MTAPILTRVRSAVRTMLPSGRHPARAVMVGFGLAILAGTLLLMLPIAREGPGAADLVTALFTATSAVCVTGLIVVDTPSYWSHFGETVIVVLIQAGGLGIMTMASLLALLMSRRLGLRMQLTAQAETKSLSLGEIRTVLLNVVKFSVAFELVLAVVLTLRLLTGHGYSLGQAVYSGVFHSVSAFNNAGFSLYSDSLVQFVTDPWICLPIAIAVICGGLGFPVWFEITRRTQAARRWSLHTKITITTTVVLITAGFAGIVAVEWTNPATLGPLGVGGKILAGFFTAVMPRTAGFNSIDVAALDPVTLLIHDVLMFIGGGSASTAGGIKVTTFALLAFVMYAEIRGTPTVHVLDRRLPDSVQRQALTIALLGVGLVITGTVALLLITRHTLDQVLFEVISAFGTVGLSTGITAQVGAAGHLVLIALMFIGRIGPITAAASLALRDRPRRYELPTERPIVG